MFHEVPKAAVTQPNFIPLWTHIHKLRAFLVGQAPWKQTWEFARGEAYGEKTRAALQGV